jgi:2-oxoglutarate dehydrogenase E2 component (dihydrolipoamide succinyltransferase)
MSERVTMPALGESVTEGTVTRWLKSVGDTVQVDEPLLEVSTDKVDTEIPSPVSGVLQEILVGEDETVPVGADLAVVGDGAAGSSDEGGQQQDQAPQGSSQESQPEQQEQAQEQAPQRDEQPDERGQAQQEQSQQEQAQQPPAPAEPDQSTGQPQQAQANGDDGGTPVTMPALGESVTEGTVTRWLKAEGDTVEVDEPLLEVSTDKVDTEIPSPVSGTVLRILVREDETVPVGADLALVGTGSGAATAPAAQEQPQQQGRGGDDLGDAAADAAAADGQSEAASSPAAQLEQASVQREASHEAAPPAPAADAQQQVQSAPEQSAPDQSAPEQSRPEHESQPQQSQPQQDRRESPQQAQDASAYVTPLVRKLASEHGVDLTSLTGTGVGGRIRKQDVLDAARARQEQEKPAAQPAAAGAPSGSPSVAASVSAKRGTTEKMTRLRRLIAQRMVESLQTSAQLTTVVEVDVTKIARLRARAKHDFESREGVKLSFLPFFALAAVEALKVHPVVNASVEDDEVVYHAQENLGIAVDTEKGLLVPVIRDAGDLNIAGLARKVADLAERTRTNKITPDELGGGTFTVTNTGSRGALFDTPIINQPQVGILGTGAVVKRPVVVTDVDGGETIAIRSMVYLALSYDHRVVDGADAARFLTTMKERLEEGAFEADLGL